MLLAGLVACSGDGSSGDDQGDREHYLAGVTRGEPEQRLAHCRAIGDEALRSDCLSALASRTGVLEGVDPESLCAEIAEGQWRDECYFVAAERARTQSELERAAQLCAHAGIFMRDCSNHLWQLELRQAVGDDGIRVMVDDHDRVQVIHDRWVEAFGGQPELSKHFWQHAYQVAFERARHIAVGVCEQVPETERETCWMTAETSFRGWLNEAMKPPGHQDALCATERSELSPSWASATIGTGTAPDHPRLIQTLQHFQKARCFPSEKGPRH